MNALSQSDCRQLRKLVNARGMNRAALVLLLLTLTIHAAEFDRSSPDCGIQKAIDALGPPGGEVVLPAGRFELLRALMLPSNVSLRGQGPDKTVLVAKRSNLWV